MNVVVRRQARVVAAAADLTAAATAIPKKDDGEARAVSPAPATVSPEADRLHSHGATKGFKMDKDVTIRSCHSCPEAPQLSWEKEHRHQSKKGGSRCFVADPEQGGGSPGCCACSCSFCRCMRAEEP